MTRFLFLTWPGAGNQVPATGIAAALRSAGHEVVFGGYAAQVDRFARLGFGLRVLPEAQRRWPDRPPADWMPALAGAVWACPGHRDDVGRLLAAERADVLVVDCLMFGALAAAEHAAVPTAVLVHSSPGALAPPGDGLERMLLPAVNEVRAATGCAHLVRLWDAWTPFRTLCTSVPELDPLADRVPAGFRFVGPVGEPAGPAGWTPPWPADDPRPLVAAGFSTGPAWDQTARIQRTLDALADGYRVVVTTAMVDPATLRIPGDAVAVPFLPHDDVFRHASAVVTHGGHGTLATAMRHGVPVVGLPNPAADQPALTAHLARRGAGIALDGENATPADIRAAVDQVVGDKRHRRAAAAIGDAVAGSPGAAGAAALLAGLVRP